MVDGKRRGEPGAQRESGAKGGNLRETVEAAKVRLNNFDVEMTGKSYERVAARGKALQDELELIARRLEGYKGKNVEAMRQDVEESFDRLSTLCKEVKEEQVIVGKIADIDEKLSNLIEIVADLSSGALSLDDSEHFPMAGREVEKTLASLKQNFAKGREKYGADQRFAEDFAALTVRFSTAEASLKAFQEAVKEWEHNQAM